MKRVFKITLIVFAVFSLIYIPKRIIKNFINKNENNISWVYKANWNIDGMPNPKKINTVLEFVGAGDILAFDIMEYSTKNFQKLKNMDIFQNFKENSKEEVKEILVNHFDTCLDYEEEDLYKTYFNLDNLSSKENYYAILHRYSDVRGNIYEVLVLDTKEQLMYSMHCNFGDKHMEVLD